MTTIETLRAARERLAATERMTRACEARAIQATLAAGGPRSAAQTAQLAAMLRRAGL